LANSKDIEKFVNLINNPESIDFKEYGPLAMVLANCLFKWVTANEQRFNNSYSIENSLKSLLTQFGDI
jgi:hypothetical protein